MFLQCLEYKSDWKGRRFVQVDRFFPGSRQCNSCKTLKETLSLKDRMWICPNCKTCHDLDINAAKNIKEEGLRQLNRSTVGHSGIESLWSGCKTYEANLRAICHEAET